MAAILLLALAAVGANAHSWVEQMRIVSNGSYTGNPGYMRGYNPRGPGFSDPLNVNLVPSLQSGRLRISDADPMCKPTQTTANQTAGYPKLSASPGDSVALRYLENGHVTLPNNQIGKPGSGGTVMVYATTQPKEDEKLMDVLQWNVNGTGGDKRGTLLTVQNFDDGRCYQINSSPMSAQRQQEFPNKPANAAPGTANEELWCETDVVLPTDAATSGDLTLYWAWQWNTLPNSNPGMPDGKDEWYTSCMDVNMLSSAQLSKASLPTPEQLLVQDPQQKANPQFSQRAANQTLPDGGADGGDGTLGDAASISSSGSATAASPAAPASTQSAPITAASPASPSTPAVSNPASIFGAGTTLLPIPDSGSAPTIASSDSSTSTIVTTVQTAPAIPTTPAPSAPQASGVLGTGSGSPHLLTLTQVMTFTVNYKRSVQTVTREVVDYAASRRRNVWA